MDIRRVGIFAALGLGVVVVALAVKSWVVIGGAVVVAGVAGYAANRALSPQSKEALPADPAAPTEPRLAEWVDHLKELARLNVRIREAALPEEVSAKLEESIDALRRLIPELNDGYVGSELTWTVNRMASDYLPRVVEPYTKLAPPAREENRAEFIGSLAGLESELENIEGMVRNHQEGDFKNKAAFLRARFLEG